MDIKFKYKYYMANNIKIIEYIILNKLWDQLLDFNNFDLTIGKKILFKLFLNNFNKDNKHILIHVITNILNLEVVDSKYNKIIHYIFKYQTDSDLIKYLIDKNIFKDFESPNMHFGNSPLHNLLIFQNDSNLIKYLIDKNIFKDFESSNINSEHPIHLLFKCQTDSNLIKYLIDKNIFKDFESRNKDNYKPIHLLFKYQRDPELIKYLIDKNIFKDFESPIAKWANEIGFKPIHLLFEYQTDSDLIKYLIDKNIFTDFDSPSIEYGYTPLFYLLRSKIDSDLIIYIINNKINNFQISSKIGNKNLNDILTKINNVKLLECIINKLNINKDFDKFGYNSISLYELKKECTNLNIINLINDKFKI